VSYRFVWLIADPAMARRRSENIVEPAPVLAKSEPIGFCDSSSASIGDQGPSQSRSMMRTAHGVTSIS
jgi:hypothetical protein